MNKYIRYLVTIFRVFLTVLFAYIAFRDGSFWFGLLSLACLYPFCLFSLDFKPTITIKDFVESNKKEGSE